MTTTKLKKALAAGLALGASAVASNALAEADLYRLAWTDDPATTMTIGWRQASGSPLSVEYRVAGTSTWNTHSTIATSNYQNLVQDPNDAAHTLVSQFATLTGLAADTAYEFRVVDSEGSNTTYWFKTAPDAPQAFTFVAGGDSRPDSATDPTDVARERGNQLVAKIRPLFVLFNGDYHDTGTYDEWVTWLTQWQSTISADGRMYPIIPAHGNHENDVPNMVQQIFGIANADAYYALNVGGNMMRLYTLNTELEPGVGYSTVGSYTSQSLWDAQTAWLQGDLDAATATWKIASYHRPLRPHTASKAEGEGRYDDWAAEFSEHGVDLAVESDSHMVKYTYPLVACSSGEGCYEGFLRDDAAGTTYIGEGAWGAPKRPIDDDKSWTMASDSVWHMHVIQATPANLTIQSAVFESEEDVSGVVALTQAEQDLDPAALPAGMNIFSPLSGETLTLPFATANNAANSLPLIAAGSEWKYLDDGSDQGSLWTEAAFDDAGWASGSAQLGYGDGDESTLVSYGPDSGNKYPTTYFRKTVNIANADDVIQLVARIMRDDGAVVYVNGTEVLRTNMPDGVITSTTYAGSAIGGAAESTFYQYYLLTDALVDGDNTIAVEVHQSDAGSSDISFDMALTAVVSNSTDLAPAAVTDLAASEVVDVTSELQLDWTAPELAVGQQLERQDTGSSIWTIIEPRLASDLASLLDDNLNEGAEYSYRLRSYNASGLSELSNIATASTFTNPIPVIYEETFSTVGGQGTFGQFQTASVTSTANWETYVYSNEWFARINGYGADVASEDWLISPAFNLRFYTDEFLKVDTAFNYGGPDLEILYSTDYDPENNVDHAANPNNATWATLSTNTSTAGGFVFESTGDIDMSGPAFEYDAVSVAFKYVSTGTGGGQGRVWEVDNFVMRGTFAPPELFSEDFENETLGGFTAISLGGYTSNGDSDWHPEFRDGQQGAIVNGFGADGPSDDWLITPPVAVTADMNAVLNFDYYSKYGGPMLEVYISNAPGTECPEPLSSDWIQLAVPLDETECYSGCVWNSVSQFDVSDYVGDNVCVAFRYLSSGTGSGEGRRWGVDNISITESLPSVVTADFSVVPVYSPAPFEFTTAEDVVFLANVVNGVEPLAYAWDFGDGNTSTEAQPAHVYAAAGNYTPSLTVTDANGSIVSVTGDTLNIIAATEDVIPEKTADLRIATFNAAMAADPVNDDIVTYLQDPTQANIRAIAEIIQRTNPDVILINEFDYDPTGAAVTAFKENFLEVSQNGSAPIVFPYHFATRVNTGTQPEEPEFEGDVDLDIDADFNNDGNTDGPDDAYGFGEYAGQYGMLILSKFPIDEANIRTLQNLHWQDMPGNLMPTDYYDASEQAMFRLSSKSHWDVPVEVNGQLVHVLASHPTPPTFDDGDADVNPSLIDWNGKRNSDEIRLWADYVDPTASSYITDDNGVSGGLSANSRFVIMGDQNADPVDGDSYSNAINQLLDSPLVDGSFVPTSLGEAEQSSGPDERRADTASWGLRADYVLPSNFGLEVEQGAVFWPQRSDVNFHLVRSDISSDHRLVWLDLSIDQLSGDVNNDGRINIIDLRFVIFNLFKPVADCEPCDVNGDGRISIIDVFRTLRAIFANL
ncbi:MAG: endonuclease/exonuclease/phosphatase family protein [Pseudomonadales bacterium]|nr:endonuclease/exonuclease/phosphatase family protein [Pseudomonadales bacterium]